MGVKIIMRVWRTPGGGGGGGGLKWPLWCFKKDYCQISYTVIENISML